MIPYEVELVFTALPSIGYVRLDTNTDEILGTLKTGLFRNQAVTRVKLFALSEDEHSESFVYDIEAAKSGQQPWSKVTV